METVEDKRRRYKKNKIMVGVYADHAIKKAPQATAEIEALAKVNYHTNIRNFTLEVMGSVVVEEITNSDIIAESEKDIKELEAMGYDPQALFDYKGYIKILKDGINGSRKKV